MNPEMEKDTFVIDDLNQYEAEKLVRTDEAGPVLRRHQGEVSIQKTGVPMKQLHSYDSGGPYAGFKGAVNFYREIDRLVNSKGLELYEGALAGKNQNSQPLGV